MSNTHEHHGIPYLTESDVHLLHEIVNRAQESEDKSSRALFQVYDTVLVERQISTNRDQKYFPFLWRMRQSSQKRTTSLVEQFTNLLSELGIEVVFDEEEDADALVTAAPEKTDSEAEPPVTETNQTLKRRGRSRRASFGEIEGSGELQASADALARPSLPPRSTSQIDIYSTRLEQQGNRTSLGPQANGQAIPPQHVRGIQKAQSGASQEARRKPVVQIRDDPSIYEFEQSVASDGVSETEEDDTRDFQRPELNVKAPSQSNGSDSKVAAFRFRRLAARAHGIFHDWHRMAMILRVERGHSLQQALRLDKSILTKQALDQWHDKFLAQHRERETIEFFDALGKRAGRARDLFLLTKAFTHWAQFASDEVLRTSAARRHILRTRFFNAWRDITAVNELKIRRQGLSKLFGAWKQRSSHILELTETAASFRSSHVAQASYRDWFWEFCDRRTPTWHESRIQARCWDDWSQLAQGYAIRARWSEGYAKVQLLRKIWILWTGRANTTSQLHSRASTFRRRADLIQNVETWRRRLFFADPVGRMSQARKTKMLHILFQTWLDQARLSLTSRTTYGLRLMRNAWTNWNDRLRCQALARAIDDRIIIQCLYKWVLAERLALYRRIGFANTKGGLLVRWRQRTQMACSDLGKAEDWATKARERRLKMDAFRRIRMKAQAQQQSYIQATHVFQRHELRKPFLRLLDRWRLNRELQAWAYRLHYLVFAAPQLEKWRKRLGDIQKTRRREAFATVRQRHRQVLRHDVLAQWKASASQLSAKHAEANRQHDQKTLTDKFSDWRLKTQQIISLDQEADMARQSGAARKAWQRMVERLQHVRHLQGQAEVLRLERVVSPAGEVALRRLSHYLFKIRAQRETADMKWRHNEERRYRLMLRHWDHVVKTRRGQQSPVQSPSLPPRLHGRSIGNNTMLSRSMAVGGTGAGATTAPTPGYLQTPLRRTTGRLRTRIPPPPATPAASHMTPFMNRLRAQYPSGLPKSARVEEVPELSPEGGNDGG